MSSEMNARPHPDPLPRGEGTAMRLASESDRLTCNSRPFVRTEDCRTTRSRHVTCKRRTFPPLLGERAGVRAVVTFSN